MTTAKDGKSMTERRTALITGASGGIGEQLANVFAQEGFDVILVARNRTKLEDLANVLSARHGIAADVIALDLSAPDSPRLLSEHVDELGLQVDVLVNNAGFADFGFFAGSDLTKQLDMIQVNITSLTELTHRFLPAMVNRGWGRILNVGSTGSFMPGPLMAVYYATKNYVLAFSEAIREELRGSGVSVTVLAPGPVATGFQAAADMERSKLLSNPASPLLDAGTVARAGYDALIRGKSVEIPGLMNRIQAFIPRVLPRSVVPGVVRRASEPSA